MSNQYTAIIHKEDDGWYWATCPEVPGANGQGRSLEEVKEDLAAAIGLMLEVMRDEAVNREEDPDAIREVLIVG